ncbi:MAG: hypothetical protein ABGX79_03355, partial [Acidimicrobiales bacterium]
MTMSSVVLGMTVGSSSPEGDPVPGPVVPGVPAISVVDVAPVVFVVEGVDAVRGVPVVGVAPLVLVVEVVDDTLLNPPPSPSLPPQA